MNNSQIPNSAQRQSTIIRALRFPLIVLVVVAHVPSTGFVDVSNPGTGMEWYDFFAELMAHNLGKIAVPLFFVFSGYFFFLKLDGLDSKVYLSQLRKRIGSLFVPYILWNMISVLADCARSAIKGWPVVVPSAYYAFWGGPANFPFWYMRDLICLTLLTPVFHWLFRYGKIYGWMILAAAYLLAPQDYNLFVGLNLRSAFFFGTGAYLGIYKKSILDICLKNKWAMYAFVPLLLVSTWFNGNEFVHHYLLKALYVVGIFMMFNVMDGLLDRRKLVDKLSMLSQTVFFIYGAHLVQIEGLLKGMTLRTVLANSAVGMVIRYFLVVMLTIAICLAIFYAMKKICPRILGILVGKRMEQKA